MNPPSRGGSILSLHRPRYFVGTALTACRRYVAGAIVRVIGRGLEAEFSLVNQLNLRTPREFRQLSQNCHASAADVDPIGCRLVSELFVINTERLLNWGGIARDEVTAVGLYDAADPPRSCRHAQCLPSLGEPALLAEALGVNVIDHFPQRDVALGGSGRWIDATAWWLLLTKSADSHSSRPRLVVRLDESIDVYYLPPRRRNRTPVPIQAIRLSPGFWLLNLLSIQCESSHQGSSGIDEAQLSQFVECLATASQQSTETPADRQSLVRQIVQQFPGLFASRTMLHSALEQSWLEMVQQAIEHKLPQLPIVEEIVLVGRGTRRQSLMQKFQRQFCDIRTTSDSTRGWIAGAPDAAVSAILAALHVDQVAANVPELTGAATARILGRITPGNPASWRHLITQMDQAMRHNLPLREAI